MISSARSTRPPANRLPPSRKKAFAAEDGYGLPFWMAYAANMLAIIANAVLYRYADFVFLLGGTELHLGWIVGVGMVGSLLMRVFLGTQIDRYGPRRIWVASLLVFSLACFAHLAVTRYDGPAIYLLRLIHCLAIAGILGSSMTFVSGRVPPARIAEMVGMLGTSGFVGLVLGTQLGDLLCGTQHLERWQVDRMFVVAGLVGTTAALFAILATRGLQRPLARRRPPLVWLIVRYQPGMVLVVGIAVGIALGLPGAFLRTYAAELGVARIGLFFAVYAAAAITTRVLTRHWPEQIGLRPMTLLGLGILVVGQLLFLPVRSESMFAIPAVAFGIGHGILFPVVFGAGAGSFPLRYRGLGSMVVLAMYDVGLLVGAPSAGAILHYSGQMGLPTYPTLFVCVAVMLTAVGTAYAWSGRRRRRLEAEAAVRSPRFAPSGEPAAEVSTSA